MRLGTAGQPQRARQRDAGIGREAHVFGDLRRAVVFEGLAERRGRRRIGEEGDRTERDGALRLEVLGAHSGLLGHGSGGRRLGLRHSEMLLLLSRAPDGLTASELALALSDRES